MCGQDEPIGIAAKRRTMKPTYHVPRHQSPNRGRVVVRMGLALVLGWFPLSIILQSQLHYYCKRIALGATFQQYVAVRPAFWAFFPLSLAMLCLVIGISRDGWLLVKRRGTPTLLPWPYRLAMLFAVIAVVLYVLNSRIP